ncbi:hypothetical protein VOI32_18510 [Paraburkholderia caribensis]|uniref:Uncharacterized protein n=1 Tax=Paraburkholderia caribensis TaxID=75105 RepID=A0A9Q6WLQ3_9BURK|nr:hypothetical protein [Paraburkholderia caribensis]MCO4879935.1 hypothetical protein [Paraburkholderia caribensis]PTB27774.1 hypothetical protein C9I56_16295 [Paraburkholderia caribensis]QLB62944.1 hypothetical protein A9O66_11460 [Paraburkholderia caribensis]
MSDYHNPIEFEKALVQVADSVLQSRGETRSRQRIGAGTRFMELDYVFIPTTAGAEDKMYVFEFKYSSSPTLADSAINTQLARFSALQEANEQRSIRFLLVTNGHASNANLPTTVRIIDDVRNDRDWRNKLTQWLTNELPRPSSRPAWLDW